MDFGPFDEYNGDLLDDYGSEDDLEYDYSDFSQMQLTSVSDPVKAEQEEQEYCGDLLDSYGDEIDSDYEEEEDSAIPYSNLEFSYSGSAILEDETVYIKDVSH